MLNLCEEQVVPVAHPQELWGRRRIKAFQEKKGKRWSVIVRTAFQRTEEFILVVIPSLLKEEEPWALSSNSIARRDN